MGFPSCQFERSGSLPAVGWPPKRRESCSDSLLFGAGGPIRTGTASRPGDFKSPVSTIPPHRHAQILYHSPRRVSREKGPAQPLPSSCRQSVDSLKSKNGNIRKSSHFCKDCNAKGDYHPLSRSPHACPSWSRWICLQSEGSGTAAPFRS